MLVANAIAQGVEDGCLAPGESLPTHRNWPALGVTIGTVSRDYAEPRSAGSDQMGVTGRGPCDRAATMWTCTRRGRMRGIRMPIKSSRLSNI